jgi:nucleoside 2-deoxyribosyltransferase
MSILTEAVCKCGKEFLSAKWETRCEECRGKRTLYTCGPIDGVTPEWATEWRRQVKESLTTWEVLDPTEGKDLHAAGVNDSIYTPDEIVEADLAMVARADVVLVDWRMVDNKIDYHFPPKDIVEQVYRATMTVFQPLRVGTIMEIVYAKQYGKQVYTFGNLRMGYWMRYHTDKHFDTVTEAIEYLRGEG